MKTMDRMHGTGLSDMLRSLGEILRDIKESLGMQSSSVRRSSSHLSVSSVRVSLCLILVSSMRVSLHLISVSSVMMKLPLISVYLLRVSRLLIFFPSVRLTLPPFCVLSEDKYSSYICVPCEVKSSSYLCPQWCKIFLISVLSEDVFLLYLCPQ